jgi:hypothetical protein
MRVLIYVPVSLVPTLDGITGMGAGDGGFRHVVVVLFRLGVVFVVEYFDLPTGIERRGSIEVSLALLVLVTERRWAIVSSVTGGGRLSSRVPTGFLVDVSL